MVLTPAPGREPAFLGSECPHPIARPLMTQVWNDAVFAHWPVSEAAVRAILPPGLEVDTFGGTAWVSLVGFEMADLRIRGLPAVPGATRFAEFNVRTYVRGPEGPGVWFCSLDVPGWLPTLVARVGFVLPYCRARVGCRREGGHERWEVVRSWPDRATGVLAVEASPADGSDPAPEPDAALVDFLTARWRLYAATPGGRLLHAPVAHEPWRMRPVRPTAVDAGLTAAAGLPVTGAPAVTHRAEPVGVRVGRPRLLPRVAAPMTVWFDDDCGVCTAAVTRLRTRADATVAFRPNRELTDPALRVAAEDAIVVTVGAEALTAVAGVRAVLGRCGRSGRIAAAALGLPGVRAVAGVAYRWVAAHRAALSTRFGLTACAVPDAQAVRVERRGR